MSRVCVHGFVSGHVQGVWYRGFVRDNAQQQQLGGWAKNLPDGRVEILLCGTQRSVDAVVQTLRTGPPMARVDKVDIRPTSEDESVQGFRIL